ncbi:tripartite tricarboxylate transporter TctB family protein [Micromonospora sp. NBC_00389]|uniref:tripartite tricarboxylate transporter TctB family protein n=1 Tax=Micromonospora sp. NBC_00389 TaxID=2903586 RepID=UPI002E1C8241
MSDVVTGETDRKVYLPDLVAGVLLTLIFGAAFVTALSWSGKAAVFPLAIGGLGALLGVAFVLRSLLRPGKRDATPQRRVGDDDEDSDEDLQYAFETASAREWAVALSYLVAFFVALYVLGLYFTAPLFAVAYLRHQAKASWVLSVVYAAVLFAVLYIAFGVVLQLPVPPGLFPVL